MGAAVAGTINQGPKSRRPKPCVATAEALTTAYKPRLDRARRRFRPTASYTTLWDATLTSNKRMKDRGRADSASGTAKKKAGRATDKVKNTLD